MEAGEKVVSEGLDACGVPWSRRDVFVQLGLLLGISIYSGVALALVFWPLVPVYAGLWAAFIVTNHYFVCRDCRYSGTLCGSFGLGRLALFKRTDKEHFDPRIAWRSMVVFTVVALFPIPFFLFLPLFWLWILAYMGLGGAFYLAHTRLGCARCPLVHCHSNPGFSRARCV